MMSHWEVKIEIMYMYHIILNQSSHRVHTIDLIKGVNSLLKSYSFLDGKYDTLSK